LPAVEMALIADGRLTGEAIH